jgi:Transmembrane secretion effector
MTECSTWTALRIRFFRQLWLASVVSGSCVAAHDGAATWMMNKLTGSAFFDLADVDDGIAIFLSVDLPGGPIGDKGMVCETPH